MFRGRVVCLALLALTAANTSLAQQQQNEDTHEAQMQQAAQGYSRSEAAGNAWERGYDQRSVKAMADLPKPGNEVKRDRVLSDAELRAIWRAADKIAWPFGPALHMLVLTVARREEITALRWSEINSDAIELTGARTKNGEPHSIPLAGSAADKRSAMVRGCSGQCAASFPQPGRCAA